jgi:tetratricopeptide (TPR) repeat protein
LKSDRPEKQQQGHRLLWRAAAVVALLVAACLLFVVARQQTPSKPSQQSESVESAAQLVAQASDFAAAGQTQRALTLLQQAIEIDPAFHEAYLYQGQLNWDLGRHDQAFEIWGRVPDSDAPNAAVARYLEGASLLDQFKAAQAETRLQKSLQLRQDYLPPAERLLSIYVQQLRQRQINDTLTHIRRIRPLNLQELAVEILAGRPLYGIESGMQRLQQFIEADPDDHSSRLALAQLHLAAGRPDESLSVLNSLITTAAENPDLNRLMSQCLIRQGRLSEAADYVNRLQLDSTSSGDSWRVYSRMLEEAGQLEDAVACLRFAISRDPFSIDLNYRLGLLQQQNNLTAEQDARLLQRTQQLDTLEQNAFLMLRSAGRDPRLVADTIARTVLLLDELGEPQLAAEWLQQGLRIDPQNQDLGRIQQAGLHQSPQVASIPVPVQQPIQLSVDSQHSAEPNAAPREGICLVDIAAEAGITGQYDTGQSGFKWIVETTGGGAGVADYDCDGDPDLFFPQGGSSLTDNAASFRLDQLWRNMQADEFTDVAVLAGLTEIDYGQGCAFGDFDNDGMPDLFVANVGHNVLYHNNGDGTFSVVSDPATAGGPLASSSVGFGDFDNDGLLDLYVVNYVRDWDRTCKNQSGQFATCLPSGFEAEQDRILHNQGDGTFADVTEHSGIVQNDGRGLGLLITDLNADGLADVYVANDGTANFVFMNDSAAGTVHFIEMGLASGAAVSGQGRAEAGMGIAAADFDDNGLTDLFVTNFYQENNRLYLNEGQLLFRDATLESGVDRPGRLMLGFGTQAMDIDLDGDQDLVIANGDIDNYESMGRPWKMQPQVLENTGQGRFVDSSSVAGSYFQGKYLGRGMARLDTNCDLVPDIVVIHQDRNAALLTNCSRLLGTPVSVRLVGTQSSRDAIGAQVTIEAQDHRNLKIFTQSQRLMGGSGFNASNELRLFFRVPHESVIQRIQVAWPSGKTDTWHGHSDDSAWTFIERGTFADSKKSAFCN